MPSPSGWSGSCDLRGDSVKVEKQRWSVEVRTLPDPNRLANDLLTGLAMDPVTIPPKWFYDDKGSQLFDAITELEEYYPTRTEQAILEAHAAELPLVGTLIELGSGYSRKTRVLLEALTAEGRPLLFVPLDVAEEPVRDASVHIAEDFANVVVEGVVADFDDDLSPLPGMDGDRMVAFLGSTIGNLRQGPRRVFLDRLRSAMAEGDYLLLGADLVKDVARLIRAYDDESGVTAAFNKNVLSVLSRELGANLDPDDFDHVARYNETDECIEMRLRARRSLAVTVLGTTWQITEGQELLTETSAKFRVEGLAHELAVAGFEVVTCWTDSDDDFSVTLARCK